MRISGAAGAADPRIRNLRRAVTPAAQNSEKEMFGRNDERLQPYAPPRARFAVAGRSSPGGGVSGAVARRRGVPPTAGRSSADEIRPTTHPSHAAITTRHRPGALATLIENMEVAAQPRHRSRQSHRYSREPFGGLRDDALVVAAEYQPVRAPQRRSRGTSTSCLTRSRRTRGMVAVEALNIRSMSRSARGTIPESGRHVRQEAGLNREILERGWGELQRYDAAALRGESDLPAGEQLPDRPIGSQPRSPG